MKIVLIRHGKPAIDTTMKVGASDFGKWVKKYDQAGIDTKHKPTAEAFNAAAQCTFIVCSPLTRSIESATALNIQTPDMISDTFRECEMPYTNWTYPKLSVISWSILFRLLQALGFSPNAESYKAIKKRAQECAKQLVTLSQEHDSVLFVGHGTLLWLVHKQLLRMGWSGPQKSAKKHWEFAVYVQ